MVYKIEIEQDGKVISHQYFPGNRVGKFIAETFVAVFNETESLRKAKEPVLVEQE